MKASATAARRPYRMTTRAEAAAATAERILDAAIEIFLERPGELSLDAVAERAGVSVQTVIRRFGGRDGLVAAACERGAERGRERERIVPGDAASAARMLVAHYESIGDQVLRILAEEDRVPGVREVTDRGRALHRRWCAEAFAPALDRLRGVERQRRLAQLVAICDVHTWGLLRRDGGLSRRQTELAIVELLEPLIGEG